MSWRPGGGGRAGPRRRCRSPPRDERPFAVGIARHRSKTNRILTHSLTSDCSPLPCSGLLCSTCTLRMTSRAFNCVDRNNSLVYTPCRGGGELT